MAALNFNLLLTFSVSPYLRISVSPYLRISVSPWQSAFAFKEQSAPETLVSPSDPVMSFLAS